MDPALHTAVGRADTDPVSVPPERRAVAIKSLNNLIHMLRWLLVFGVIAVALAVVLGIVRSDLPGAATGGLIGVGAVLISLGTRGVSRVRSQMGALEQRPAQE